MTCPNCKKEADRTTSRVVGDDIVTGCDSCLGMPAKHGQNDIARYNRLMDYRDHAQDLTQPFEGKAYLKTRGIDKAREQGFSDEDIRQLY